MWLLGLLPFAGALASRLAYHRWEAWVSWVATSLIAFLVIWLAWLPASQTFGIIAGASVLGFIAPELWEALRAFLRRPRNAGLLAGGGIVSYLLFFQPQTLGKLAEMLAVLGIIAIGFMVMFRPFRRRGGR